ncbi:hypothetical protein TNCV_3984451 [Trichonephila clavipes]|nr:hypothetical protein TNCV_3984451 [Trichonephila clavipes]
MMGICSTWMWAAGWIASLSHNTRETELLISSHQQGTKSTPELSFYSPYHAKVKLDRLNAHRVASTPPI